MSRFWDTWATRHRNWRAISTATGFLLILAWGGIEMKSNQLVDTTEETATVLELRRHSTASASSGRVSCSGSTMYTGKLMLSDSTTVELLLFSPLPRVGDKMPMTVQHYSDGKKYYGIDQQEWQMNGPK